MNRNIRRGFTLIEMLVVVVIIATLAAIAVPQYQRAVYRSRFHALIPVAHGIYEGNEAYYLGNREYADSLASLVVTGQNQYPDGTSVQLNTDENYSYVKVQREGLNNNYVMYQSHSKQFPSNIHCEAKKGDDMAAWLCSSAMGGRKIERGGLTSGYDSYILEGDASDGNFAADYVNESNITLKSGDTCTANKVNECQNLVASEAECSAVGVNGGCSNSSYDDGSACSTVNGGKQGCAFSEFSNNSTCTAGSTSGKVPVAGCQRSVFTNGSSCVVNQNNTSSANDTACGGNSSGGKLDTTGANSAQYYASTCINESTNSYGCGRSHYKEGSTCTSSPTNGGCGNSLYDASRCIGRSNGCDKSKFINGSVCEAWVSGACATTDSTYDSTSYCTGKNDSSFSYCPVGTPAPPDTPGGQTTQKWRKCTAAEIAQYGLKSGMSCFG